MTPTAPWPGVLGFPRDKFAALMAFVEAERERHPDEVYPEAEDVFAAFRLTALADVKVVLLGQDPYPLPGDAVGLSFSVRRDRPLPASLRTISTMMTKDGLRPLAHGDLSGWGQQGVLLLNTALTVVKNQPGSHLEQWAEFTQAVIALLSARDRPMVFLLWGAKAQAWEDRIDTPKHKVVTAPHPTSREPFRTEFLTSRSFSKVNTELARLGETRIDWEILSED